MVRKIPPGRKLTGIIGLNRNARIDFRRLRGGEVRGHVHGFAKVVARADLAAPSGGLGQENIESARLKNLGNRGLKRRRAKIARGIGGSRAYQWQCERRRSKIVRQIGEAYPVTARASKAKTGKLSSICLHFVDTFLYSCPSGWF
jgi:hypothetical protein